MNLRKLLLRAQSSPSNVRFRDFQRLIEAFGFSLDRIGGSHHIYLRKDVAELVNAQEVRGMAKPYQIRQFLKLVERYDLRLRGENDQEE